MLFGLTYSSPDDEQPVQVWGPAGRFDVDEDLQCSSHPGADRRRTPSGRGGCWASTRSSSSPTGPARDPIVHDDGGGSADPWAAIRDGVRDLRSPDRVNNQCYYDADSAARRRRQAGDPAPIWPWGLAANLALGAAGVVVAVRRLTIPSRKLARGTRVA